MAFGRDGKAVLRRGTLSERGRKAVLRNGKGIERGGKALLRYVNRKAQDSGEHEIHEQRCRYLPTLLNRRYLASFRTCHQALKKARTLYRQVDGCYFCSRGCHTG